MAYFPANATFEGCLADLHAAAISNPGQCAFLLTATQG
jgi:hypothetical protein